MFTLRDIRKNTDDANDPFVKALNEIEKASKEGKSCHFFNLNDNAVAERVFTYLKNEGFTVTKITEIKNVLSYPLYNFAVHW